ncbi:MAG: hypothetical protein ACTH1D_06485 [Mycobacteriaceae bacterium]|uniref:hypothetical protein n=1 Tax=Corynebacterium sp. TaxID=1720 RepID=UPI003F959F99
MELIVYCQGGGTVCAEWLDSARGRNVEPVQVRVRHAQSGPGTRTSPWAGGRFHGGVVGTVETGIALGRDRGLTGLIQLRRALAAPSGPEGVHISVAGVDWQVRTVVGAALDMGVRPGDVRTFTAPEDGRGATVVHCRGCDGEVLAPGTRLGDEVECPRCQRGLSVPENAVEA